MPLRKWFYGITLIVTSRRSISSYQLAKELGITQKSAWFIGHRLSAACQNNDHLLSGFIEMDEMYLRGKKRTYMITRKLKVEALELKQPL